MLVEKDIVEKECEQRRSASRESESIVGVRVEKEREENEC